MFHVVYDSIRKFTIIMIIKLSLYRLNLKTKGSTEFITRRPWVVAPERSEGATKGLRVINYVDHVGFEV